MLRCIILTIISSTLLLLKSNSVLAEEAYIFSKNFGKGWKHYGWAPFEIDRKVKAAKINFKNWGGWIIASPKDSFTGQEIQFKAKFPTEIDILKISISNRKGEKSDSLKISKKFFKKNDKWWLIQIPMGELNPLGFKFDKIKIQANRKLGDTWVYIKDLKIVGFGEKPKTVKREFATINQSTSLKCTKISKKISPYIYGIAYSPRRAYRDTFIGDLNATVRRWGGNPSSRYNWKLGNAWNTSDDWYYRNLNYTPNPNYTWREFLEQNIAIGAKSSITVPLLGWVAKDTKSYSFPVKVFGKQSKVAPENSDAGNGILKDGTKIINKNPERTSIKVDHNYWRGWVEKIMEFQKKKKKNLIHTLFLGNEPMLWNTTHRDVRPFGAGYQELFQKTIDYSKMIRSVDPKVMIAGPTLWGWTAYHYSAKDAEVGYRLRPDRRSHGDTPLLEWYLKELRKYQSKTGHKSLDILDIHYYPQADNVTHNVNSPKLEKLRLRTVRSLWDKSYVDESWIDEPVYLLPRMQKMIKDFYPGLKLSIGEYNFGGESHMSGGLALAEILGLFGAFDVYSAYYWTYPYPDTPAYNAFKIFRDYDGKKSVYLNNLIDWRVEDKYSYFLSTNKKREKFTLVYLNKHKDKNINLSYQLKNCNTLDKVRHFTVSGQGQSIQQKSVDKNSSSRIKIPAWSINMIEFSYK